MSLCCLLIETIQCYRLGWPSSHTKDLEEWASRPENATPPCPDYKLSGPFDRRKINSGVAFEAFFNKPEHKQYFPDVNGDIFYHAIRCGLLHQAQTKESWRILRSGKQWDDSPNQKTINRIDFTEGMKKCFESFLEELEATGWNEEPWKSTRKKIWWLTQTS
jgi:hypothetical protein